MDPRSRVYRIANLLAHPRAGLYLAALAALLCVPSLWTGLMVDDYWLLAGSAGIPGVEDARSPLDLFAFYKPADVAGLKERGVLPWWSLPDSRFAFWRPLTSATHWLDFTLWPGRPAVMHLHSVAWLVALVLVVWRLHRRIDGATWVAGLATLLYAIDDARAIPAGWLASRNAIVAACFALGALILHARWRKGGCRLSAVGAPLLLVAGLLSNEGAIALGAFLLAYAIFLDEGGVRGRALSLAPYALVVIAWRVVYVLGGYGIQGGDYYFDPLGSPLRFLAAVVQRGPALLLGQWALPPSDVFVLPTMPPAGLVLLWIFAVVVVCGVTLLLWPLLREDRTSRFWFAAMLLAVVPSCAAGTGDRLLVFAGVAATPLLARFLAAVRDGVYRPRFGLTRALARPFYFVLIAVHLVLAPVLFLTNTHVLHAVWSGFEQTIREAPLGDCRGKTMVVVNAEHLFMFVPAVRGLNDLCVPERMRSLGPTTGAPVPLSLSRTDEYTVVVRPHGGFSRGPLDHHRRLELGDRIELPGMTARILGRDDENTPIEVAFVFDVRLEDESLIWLVQRGHAFERFSPPAMGETVEIGPDQSF